MARTGTTAMTAAAISSFHWTWYSPFRVAMPTGNTYMSGEVVSTSAVHGGGFVLILGNTLQTGQEAKHDKGRSPPDVDHDDR